MPTTTQEQSVSVIDTAHGLCDVLDAMTPDRNGVIRTTFEFGDADLEVRLVPRDHKRARKLVDDIVRAEKFVTAFGKITTDVLGHNCGGIAYGYATALYEGFYLQVDVPAPGWVLEQDEDWSAEMATVLRNAAKNARGEERAKLNAIADRIATLS